MLAAQLRRVEMLARSLGRRYFPHESPSLIGYDPYDRAARESRAQQLLSEMRGEPRHPPLEACQRILGIIEQSFPTRELAAEYFSQLEILLRDIPQRVQPGQLVIGLGPGRCGSTSLAAMLGTAADSICTHETPPLIFWNPEPEQVDFHLRRFRILASHFALVADVSHWWLNTTGRVLEEFPGAKFIGLIRDPDECAMSFMRIQGFGKNSFNPWARGNDFWRSGYWDATYPTFALPSDFEARPDFAKLELITRYVSEYNTQVEQAARSAPDRLMLVRTEELALPEIHEKIFAFAQVHVHGATSTQKLNAKRTTDGTKNRIKF